MNKKEYLKVIDLLNFDKSEYIIISGGVMLMYGLRETTSDVDLQITPKLFDFINNKYDVKPTNKFNNHYEFDDIEIIVREFNRDDVEVIDSYPVLSIVKELAWKLENSRAKDEADIFLINEYLSRKN